MSASAKQGGHNYASTAYSNQKTHNEITIQFISNLQYLWPHCVADAAILFCSCGFFFFPHLISAVADWMSIILPHMMWP